jgi:hypothetical protein
MSNKKCEPPQKGSGYAEGPRGPKSHSLSGTSDYYAPSFFGDRLLTDTEHISDFTRRDPCVIRVSNNVLIADFIGCLCESALKVDPE